jgi:hypothetical protein
MQYKDQVQYTSCFYFYEHIKLTAAAAADGVTNAGDQIAFGLDDRSLM